MPATYPELPVPVPRRYPEDAAVQASSGQSARERTRYLHVRYRPASEAGQWRNSLSRTGRGRSIQAGSGRNRQAPASHSPRSRLPSVAQWSVLVPPDPAWLARRREGRGPREAPHRMRWNCRPGSMPFPLRVIPVLSGPRFSPAQLRTGRDRWPDRRETGSATSGHSTRNSIAAADRPLPMWRSGRRARLPCHPARERGWTHPRHRP